LTPSKGLVSCVSVWTGRGGKRMGGNLLSICENPAMKNLWLRD
jgi:hypothetical protein